MILQVGVISLAKKLYGVSYHLHINFSIKKKKKKPPVLGEGENGK